MLQRAVEVEFGVEVIIATSVLIFIVVVPLLLDVHFKMKVLKRISNSGTHLDVISLFCTWVF